MAEYEVRVFETVIQEKVYTVEAETAEEAREFAESGETLSEDFVRDVEVTNRTIISGPELLGATPADDDAPAGP